jgi:MoxR-like ATPase
MAESRITVDGKEIELPKPFMVLATQNPVEFIGTYPLPEAQTDRFLMMITVGYPSENAEKLMAKKHLSGELEEEISPVCTAEDIIGLQEQVKNVTISDALITYIANIIKATRNEESFAIGASPRAMLALIDASRAKALIEGRDFVKPDDVKAVAVNVLHHRLKLTGEARIKSENIDRILKSLILSVKVPMN